VRRTTLPLRQAANHTALPPSWRRRYPQPIKAGTGDIRRRQLKGWEAFRSRRWPTNTAGRTSCSCPTTTRCESAGTASSRSRQRLTPHPTRTREAISGTLMFPAATSRHARTHAVYRDGVKSFADILGGDGNYTFAWLRLGSEPSDEQIDDILRQIRSRTRGFLTVRRLPRNFAVIFPHRQHCTRCYRCGL